MGFWVVLWVVLLVLIVLILVGSDTFLLFAVNPNCLVTMIINARPMYLVPFIQCENLTIFLSHVSTPCDSYDKYPNAD